MATLTTLDILYISLTIFSVIIWTLLSIILFKVIKILNPVLEILSYYEKLKSFLWMYSNIPNIIKEKTKEFLANLWNNKNESSTKKWA
jgi:hypothetical protein